MLIIMYHMKVKHVCHVTQFSPAYTKCTTYMIEKSVLPVYDLYYATFITFHDISVVYIGLGI